MDKREIALQLTLACLEKCADQLAFKDAETFGTNVATLFNTIFEQLDFSDDEPENDFKKIKVITKLGLGDSTTD